MSINKRCLVAVSLASALVSACTSERQVSYKQDVVPVLKANCLECHMPGGKGHEAAGLLMDSHDNLMKGTRFGPIVNAGNSLTSVLNQVVEGRVDKSIQMPHGGKQLSEEDIETLKLWVDQGAKDN